jgi:protoporphyrinogen oxidase
MTAAPRRVAVLGAGALGLTSALRLAQRGLHVTVIEREPLPGGLAAGFELEAGVWLEKFYHHLFRTDRRAIALIEELGLGSDLVWSRPRTVVFRRGSLHRLDSPGSLLRFAPLPLVDRLRMGAILAALKLVPDGSLFEGRTAARWLRQWQGDRSFRVVWEPLLRAKFGDRASEIGMPWFWARVHDRTTELGYLRGGFQHLYDRLATEVTRTGGSVRLGESVRGIRASHGGLEVATDAGAERFEAVLSTLPLRATCTLANGLPADYRERYAGVEAYGAHCLILALERPLTDAYWVNINDPGYPFMALVEHTNFLPSADYGGRHLVYLGNYRPMSDPLMGATKDSVLADFLPQLAKLAPAFRSESVRESWMFAAPFAQPIVGVGYRELIPPFRTPLSRLWLANMFQVYPHDRGQNYSIELAERVVREMVH